MRTAQRAAVLPALAFALGLNAQPSQAAESTYRESVEVDVVNVEVQVVDKTGRPITDLEVEDFELFENGQPVEISHFSWITRSSPGSSSDSPVEPEAGTASIEPIGPQIVGQPLRQSLWLVIYVDNISLRPGDRRRALEALPGFLDGALGEETRVMVVSFDRTLKIRQSFTSDREAVETALAEIESSPCRGSQRDNERRDLLQRIDELDSARVAVETIKTFADSVEHETRRTLDAIGRVVESLSGLPGRKALLHVSSGLPAIPGAELFLAIEHKFGVGYGVIRMQEWDLKDDYRSLARSAALHGVAIYPLDAGGVRPAGSATVLEDGYDTARMAGPVDSDTRVNLQQPLRQLADESGGAAILNHNSPGSVLQKVAESLWTRYSLGFSPGHEGDGAFHGLRVEVARQGARVRHRSGYVHRTPEHLRSERMRAALMFSFEDNPLNVALSVGRATEAAGGGFVVPLELEIPLQRLGLLPEGDEHRGSLRILVAFRDEMGRVSEVVESPLELRVPRASLETSTDERWSYTHRLILRGGEHVLALGIHDEVSGLTSFLRRSASVGG